MNLHAEVDTSAWSTWARQMDERIRALSPAHEKVGDLLVEEMKQSIDQGINPALSASTLTAERRKYGTTPLKKTLALYNDLRKLVADVYVEVGSTMRQSWALFLGSDRIPARNPFNWREGVLERCLDIYLRYIVLGTI